MNLEMNLAFPPLFIPYWKLRPWAVCSSREERQKQEGYTLRLGWQIHQQTLGPCGLGAWVLFSQNPILLGWAMLTLGLVHDFPWS